MPLQATSYVERRKHVHGLSLEQVETALQNEVRPEVQDDGRLRIWGYLPAIEKHVRVIMLPDEETVLDAFPDRHL